MQILNQNDKNIYCIIPGFLGNYTDGFTKKLFDHLVKHAKNVYCVKFFGHEKNEKKLWNLDEMKKHLIKEILELKNNPLAQNKKITLLAHSQGCAVTLDAILDTHDKNISLTLLAPAIYIDEIILPRISKDDKEKIQKSQKPVLCKVSKKNYKLLDKNWFSSYKNFSINEKLPHITNDCHIIFPSDDFIPQKNIHILEKKMPHTHTDIIDSNHFFDKNVNDLNTLITICKI
ncbi:MAG: hypothetical protein CR972_01770 [Candidatus Moraniibacteriota bacterium]|nr:MAG: hypothetical protein CR972_01770 [Candidatus Moranbacteria bacterium]